MKPEEITAKIKSEQKRAVGLITSRTEEPEGAFWLSFAGEDGFHGAVIVHAEDFLTAVMVCNLHGINPHGEVQGMEIPPEGAAQIPAKWKNRILSRAECEQFDREMSESL